MEPQTKFFPKGEPTEVFDRKAAGTFQSDLYNLALDKDVAKKRNLLYLVLLIICVLSIIFIATTANYKTYVVRVDNATGQVETGGQLKATNYKPQEAEIKTFLAQFIADTRTIPLDPVQYKNNWNRSRHFMTQEAAQKINAIVSKDNPVGLLGRMTVQPQIRSIQLQPGSNSTYQVRWIEEEYAISGNTTGRKVSYVLYFEAQRHLASKYNAAKIDIPIVQKMEDERAGYYAGQKHFETSYYFIVYSEPPQLLKSRITDAFIADAKNKGQNKADMRVYCETVEKFISNVNLIGNMLQNWFPDIKPLDASGALSYLHSNISDKRFPVKVNHDKYITDYICDTDVLGGREMKLGEKHIKLVTILDFPPMSTPGAFDVFNNMDIEYRWVSRYICLSKMDAMEELKNFLMRWNQQIKSFWTQVREAVLKEKLNDAIDETAVMNKDDVSVAMQELGQDAVSYGYYTMTMMVSDANKDRCTDKANRILEAVNSLGYCGYIETDNSMEAWWGSIPGCYRANIRRPIVNSLNFCHLAPVTSIWPGERQKE